VHRVVAETVKAARIEFYGTSARAAARHGFYLAKAGQDRRAIQL
jgi:hypothetical protein